MRVVNGIWRSKTIAFGQNLEIFWPVQISDTNRKKENNGITKTQENYRKEILQYVQIRDCDKGNANDSQREVSIGGPVNAKQP